MNEGSFFKPIGDIVRMDAIRDERSESKYLDNLF